ncbi:hypothetical protein ACKGJY_08475 [Hyunsoonleella sp. 2307UL5-6]|uniref:hypothetical protein n=1 Tax=Hyunsoonleella sp. 2307UL5-6 TaxID=3384768 RepID=UPI0039BD2798
MHLKELEWANIYHDSIRGKKSLENLPLNIGRWAGNYAFFYVLNRVLTDFKPKKILEFGLGESTKFITTFIDNYIPESSLKTIEHDAQWKKIFLQNLETKINIDIEILELTECVIDGCKTNTYLNIKNVVDKNYDLYIIDGPFGSINYSRYDIVNLLDNMNSESEFIIIMDDYNRPGEKQTVKVIKDKLLSKNIEIHTAEYVGNKSLYVIATNKYKYAISL